MSRVEDFWIKRPLRRSLQEMPIPGCISLQRVVLQRRTIAEWQQQFGMNWKSFLAAKKLILSSEDYLVETIMQWDDWGGLESFRNAETRFWVRNTNVVVKPSSPNKSIEEVIWDENIDSNLVEEEKKALQVEGRRVIERVRRSEDINATESDVGNSDYRRQAELMAENIAGDEGTSCADELQFPYYFGLLKRVYNSRSIWCCGRRKYH